MQLQVVLAFALLLWWPDGRVAAPLLGTPWTAAMFVWGKLVVFAVAARLVCLATRARLTGETASVPRALSRYHRAAFALRTGALVGVCGDLFGTCWPEWLASRSWLRIVPGFSQLALLVPYFLSLVIVWWLLSPVEHAVRDPGAAVSARGRWRWVVFSLRHQVLIVALPLGMLVVTYAATDEYREWFVGRIGSPWAPEAVLGLVASVMFVLSPLMLRRIWATSALPDGPLRQKLLGLCGRIGLRVREILVWHSDGLMVNAAVMGLFPRVRYILLSDTLLDSMTDEEIEAVFGHEAGHVRHHHIPYFLLFALASMLICAGVMEILLHLGERGGPGWLRSPDIVQALGFASIVPVWGAAFGWVSRRFERQADMFGARCASPVAADCGLPCVLHDGDRATCDGVCARGAGVFIQALRKVALLNGIPPEERSWRHSSIASRMRFLTALAGDPIMARRFLRRIRRIKLTLVLGCSGGLIFAAAYIWRHPGYRQAVTKSVIEPLRRVFE